MEKYGKPINDILDIKKNFILDNRSLLEDRKRVAEIYKQQKNRDRCIICNSKLDSAKSFNSHELLYYICPKCGHINGQNIETENFANEIYVDQDYGKTYRVDKTAYWDKVKKIYTPKLEFLNESLTQEYVSKCEILDIGAGSGFFVAAGLNNNLKIQGIEVSQQQVDYANLVIGRNCINKIEPKELTNRIEASNAKILTAFGVFEHLTNLHEVLKAICNNRNIEYIYFSIPMFSLSVLLEMMNPHCFNRQLGGAHTHLFSNNSLDYLMEMYGFKKLHLWRFGTDIMDFYRMCMVNNSVSNCVKEILTDNFEKVANDLQLTIDKAGLSSEIHIIVKNG